MNPAAIGILTDPKRFIGTWSVQRKIVDHRACAAYAFTGSADVTDTHFREQGEMQIAGRAFQATRAYRLAMSGSTLVVSYPDATEFFGIDLTEARFVHHSCGADLYAGRLFARSEDAWAEAWRVKGPRKHYSSLSLYQRLSRVSAASGRMIVSWDDALA
jgi:hypothetical protein